MGSTKDKNELAKSGDKGNDRRRANATVPSTPGYVGASRRLTEGQLAAIKARAGRKGARTMRRRGTWARQEQAVAESAYRRGYSKDYVKSGQ